jgi:hypothetical protein
VRTLTPCKVDGGAYYIGDHGSPVDTISVPVVAISFGGVHGLQIKFTLLNDVVVAK